MTQRYEIEVSELPKGWQPVAFRKANAGESIKISKDIITATHDHITESLIVEKILPRRIIFEETSEVRQAIYGDYINYGHGLERWQSNDPSRKEYKIWREVDE